MGRLIALLLRRPIAAGIGLLGLTAVCVYLVLTGFQVEGDIAETIKGRSQAYADFQTFEAQFGAPSKDEVFMVQAADFGADGALDALEDLVIELSLTDGVLGVMSVFSMPDPSGAAMSYLLRPDLTNLSDADKLDRVLAGSPLARQVMAQDRTTTLVSLIPDRSMPTETRLALLETALQTADSRLSVTAIGLTALQRTIATSLIDDILFLLPMSILVCLLMSLAVFRSWRAAVICTIPPVLGLIWSLAAMAALNIPMTAILAIAPTVLIVLGIADSVHVFNAIAHKRAGAPMAEAISRGLIETLPAIVLATVTTVLAFASLLVVGSPTLSDLAVVGGLGLVLTLLAVILTVPVTCRLLLPGMSGRGTLVSFGAISRAAIALLARRRLIGIAALALLAVLTVTQLASVPGFNITDHVPHKSDLRAAMDVLNRKLPGSDQLYVVIEAAHPGPVAAPEDIARLRAASAALYGDPLALPTATDDLPLDNASVRRFLAPDNAAFALPVPVSLSENWTDTLARAEAVRADLRAAGLGDVSTITGYMLMASVEIPNLIAELRTAFYIAVGLVTLLAAVLLRSVWLALVSLVPNLIPILGIEAWLVLWDQPLTLTGAIALTIAFGIAVDDTIHLLNRLRLARATLAHPTRAEIAEAIAMTVPPVVTTSLILFVGFGLTMFSTLPSAALFGQLVAGAMVLALLADLFLFPSLLAWLDRTEDAR